jgi:Transposase DDE domain
VFVQATKSKRGDKVYTSYLVRESFRTPEGPRSRTVCNISALPPDVRNLVSGALAGRQFLPADSLCLTHALDCGGLAVLVDAWRRLGLDRLLGSLGTPRQRSLLQALIFARLLFPSSKLALKDHAAGSLLALACGLPANERFDEDELYDALDALSGHWIALEKGLAAQTFPQPPSLVLYDLTSVYFEGDGPKNYARFGHSRDHRNDRQQILLAVATDTRGVPLHLSILRGNRADTTTLQGLMHTLRRRFGLTEAVFVFDGGMSSKVNLAALEKEGFKFVTRLSNSTLASLLEELPAAQAQLELGSEDRLVEIEHEGKRHVLAGGPWRRQRDAERRELRLTKAEAALAKIKGARRKKPNAQKIASQVGRTLQALKAHKYFTYLVDAQGVLQWERKEEDIAAEQARDGWYLLHTNLPVGDAPPTQVQGHYKNLLEVEEAFCELKSYLRVRPIFHHRPDRVFNHVRVCFLAYWLSARLATEWRERGERGEVTRLLRELQTIRLGTLEIGGQTILRLTQVPTQLNPILERLGLLHLFSSPPKWATGTAP